MGKIREAFKKSTLAVSLSTSYILYLIIRVSLESSKLAFIVALLELYPYFLIEYLPTTQIISLFFQSLLILIFAIIVLIITSIMFISYRIYKSIKNKF